MKTWIRILIVVLNLLIKQACEEKKLVPQKVMGKADASLHRSRKNWQVGFCVLERWTRTTDFDTHTSFLGQECKSVTRTLLLKHGEASHWLPCQVAPVRPSLPDMTGLPARLPCEQEMQTFIVPYRSAAVSDPFFTCRSSAQFVLGIYQKQKGSHVMLEDVIRSMSAYKYHGQRAVELYRNY